MSALHELTRHDERLDLLDAVIYGDAFDCAVTFDELWRYARAPIAREELRRRVRNDPAIARIVAAADDLFCLHDRPELIQRRAARSEHARVLQTRARRITRVLRHVPFVRGLALTGSVAADDAGEDADVDVLVMVEPGRIGLVFLLLGSASRVLGRRLFCPNYYVPADRLEFPAPRNVYIARELAQARTLLAGPRTLRDANPWVGEIFPNGIEAEPPSSCAGSLVQRLFETPFRGRVGDHLERWARKVAASRLQAHYGGFGRDVPERVASELEAGAGLRFHAGTPVDSALNRYSERRAELAARLEHLDRDRTVPSSSRA